MLKFEQQQPTAPPDIWDEANQSALFRQVVTGRLSVSAAHQHYGLAAEQVVEWLRRFRRSTLLAFEQRLEQRLVAQGAPAGALGGAEFSGTLSDLSVADLVQIIELSAKHAVISVAHDGSTSHLWCSSGAIVDAASGRLTGEAAVYRILGLERGRVLAELRASDRPRSVHTSTPALLLEAARRKDESVALRLRLGDERCRYALGPQPAASAERAERAERADVAATLRLFERACSLHDALAQSALGDFETLSLLCRLKDEGLIVDASAAGAESTALVPLDGHWKPQPSASLRSALDAVSARVLLPAASWLGVRWALRDPKSQRA
jgi:hypothetical protein